MSWTDTFVALSMIVASAYGESFEQAASDLGTAYFVALEDMREARL